MSAWGWDILIRVAIVEGSFTRQRLPLRRRNDRRRRHKHPHTDKTPNGEPLPGFVGVGAVGVWRVRAAVARKLLVDQSLTF